MTTITNRFVRLSIPEIECLKESVLKRDPNATVHLFGSRTDPDKKGGDIDIVILSRILTRQDIRAVRLEFFDTFGEQKLDIVLDTPEAPGNFTRLILEKAVKL